MTLVKASLPSPSASLDLPLRPLQTTDPLLSPLLGRESVPPGKPTIIRSRWCACRAPKCDGTRRCRGDTWHIRIEARMRPRNEVYHRERGRSMLVTFYEL
jgi:hypothetical protein